MAYPPTKNTWVAGERVDAADLNEFAALDTAWGVVSSASTTANSAAFTAIADISGLSVTFTAIASRQYVISFAGTVMSTVASDRIDVVIADGTPTQLKSYPAPALPASVPVGVTFFTVPQTPSAGSVTYKIRAQRTTGTGSCTIQAAATNPAVITVMDIGPA